MYYPYFRGKQFELITVRECAQLMSNAGFVPVIEPVREQTSGLKKAVESLCEHDTQAIIVANPQIGDLVETGDITSFIKSEFADCGNLHFGLIVTDEITLNQISTAFGTFDGSPRDLIHHGFGNPKALGELAANNQVSTSLFLDSCTGKLYQRHFKGHSSRVLLRDGFQQRRNRDHPDTPEFFSDLHITYEEEGMDGFGDFLIVGDEYLESGGPAYTIAIHLTFIDGDKDDAMYIQHFKSDRQDTPRDPAGKFGEAVAKLVEAVDQPDSKYVETDAVNEFRSIHESGHYPGLGYVKKLSMKHHVETLASFLKNDGGD